MAVTNFQTTEYRSEILAEALSQPNRPQVYALHIGRSGSFLLDQDGRQESMGIGDVAVMDTRVAGFSDYSHGASGSVISMPIKTWEALVPPPFLQRGYVLRRHLVSTRLAYNIALELAQSGNNLIEEHKATLVRQLIELIGLATTESSDRLPGSLQKEMRLRRIKLFIVNQLSNSDLDLRFIADHFGVSTRYLSKLFAEDGQTVMDFIWKSRLSRASELIDASRVSKTQLKEICYICGFKTMSHFSKLFSDEFGLSPSQYKNNPREI